MEYKSERLLFREFTKDDFDLIYSLFSDEHVMRYAYKDKFDTAADLMPYFSSILENTDKKEDRKSYEFAVFLKENGSFVGFADIEIRNKNALGGYGEIGYFLAPEAWGAGFATEIAKTLVGIGFRDLQLHRVYATCNANNLRSEMVMKKCGMTKEGESRKVRFKNNRWENEHLYSILVEEWKTDLV
jgi:Acetyltransferases, including N-acetylases of ribosomal proteins